MTATKVDKMAGFLLVLLVVIFLTAVRAQTTAAPVTNGFEVTGERDWDGTCQCTVTSPILVTCTNYQTQSTSQKLRDIQDQITNLTLDVTKLYETTNWHSELITTFEANLVDATSAFHLIEGGQLVVTRAEIEGIRRNVRNMASALYTLREWVGIESDEAQERRIQNIMIDVSNMSLVVDTMIELDNSEDLGHMQLRISELSNQLRTCNGQQSSSDASDRIHYSPLTTVGTATVTTPSASQPSTDDHDNGDEAQPELWPTKSKQDSCGRLVSISEPYTLRGNMYSAGAWMRDPIVHPDIVYYHNFTSSTQDKPFEGSENLYAFQRAKTHRIEGENLHHIVEAIVYNGSLFSYSELERTVAHHSSYRDAYGRYRPTTTYNTTVEQNLTKITWSGHQASNLIGIPGDLVVEREISSDAPLDLLAYTAPNSVPKMDFTVDETGLWLLYSNELEMLVVSKVDQETLEFERTLETSYPKNRVGNCFMICKRVYCLNSATRFDSRVTYYMDTDTGFEGFVNLPFIIKYGSLSSIEYNPRDQVLYGWDNGHAVVYGLTFE